MLMSSGCAISTISTSSALTPLTSLPLFSFGCCCCCRRTSTFEPDFLSSPPVDLSPPSGCSAERHMPPPTPADTDFRSSALAPCAPSSERVMSGYLLAAASVVARRCSLGRSRARLRCCSEPPPLALAPPDCEPCESSLDGLRMSRSLLSSSRSCGSASHTAAVALMTSARGVAVGAGCGSGLASRGELMCSAAGGSACADTATAAGS